MNLLTIIILLLLLVFAIDGYRKGLVRTLTALMFFVVSGILVYQATPYISAFVKKETPVYQLIETPCEKMIEEAIQSVTEGKSRTESGEVPRNDQSRIIKALPLPQSLQTQLLDQNNSYTYENLAVKTFSEYLSSSVSTGIALYFKAFVTTRNGLFQSFAFITTGMACGLATKQGSRLLISRHKFKSTAFKLVSYNDVSSLKSSTFVTAITLFIAKFACSFSGIGGGI